MSALPPWVRAWVENEDDAPLVAHVPKLRELVRGNDELRDLLTTFPPGCVVRCLCGKPHPREAGIAVHVRSDKSIGCTRGPGERDVFFTASTKLEPIAYRGVWTPELMAKLLSDDHDG